MVATLQHRLERLGTELEQQFPGQVLWNEPLSRHTTYQVGGPARVFFEPPNESALQQVLRRCHQEDVPVFILGSGSNILVHDQGLDMLVIRLGRCRSRISHQGLGVTAGAGALVSDLVLYCEEHSLAGLEFMAGIPGTVGGALRMNAGAFTGEIGDRVEWVTALTPAGEPLRIPASEAGFGYRRAEGLQGKILTTVRLRLEAGNREVLRAARMDILARREARQPLEYGSCGSVFKRPPGGYAGAFIEQAGCKGMRIGGAMVSPKHANFIVNYQHATAQDIYRLIRAVQQKVYEKFQVWLELEVKLVGFTTEEKRAVELPAAGSVSNG